MDVVRGTVQFLDRTDVPSKGDDRTMNARHYIQAVRRRVAQVREKWQPPPQQNTDAMLVFFHMPKTAGTRMREVMRQHTPDERTLELYSPAQIAFWSDETVNQNYDAIFGHTGYALMNRLSRPVQSITVLRDPVDRVLSLYFFWREVETVPGDPGPELAKNLDLLQFVTSEHPVITASIHNAMAWFYFYDLSIPARHDFRGISDHDLLAKAAANLDQMTFICLQERFAESLTAMSRCFGWPEPVDRPANANPKRLRRDEVSPEIIAAIEKRVGVDVALYRHAEQRAMRLIDQYSLVPERKVA